MGNSSLTRAGVLCLQIWKTQSRGSHQRVGLDHSQSSQRLEAVDPYEWYYHAQAKLPSTGVSGGAKYWRAWNKDFQQIVCGAQASDGHWPHGKHFHGDTDISHHHDHSHAGSLLSLHAHDTSVEKFFLPSRSLSNYSNNEKNNYSYSYQPQWLL